MSKVSIQSQSTRFSSARSTILALAVKWVELGRVPDWAVRIGIRHFINLRLSEVHSNDVERSNTAAELFIASLKESPLALVPEKANEQHYEVPSEFFATVLGSHRKYSCALWQEDTKSLSEAEAAALSKTCERAELVNGQRILELGCGWGSLTLWMASHYPDSEIVAISNSHSQRETIEALAKQRGLGNVRIITADVNQFDISEKFDRVVSVEMFEHLRNWPDAFARIARWLQPGGKFFMHVFVHGGAPYSFEARDEADWMSRFFFSGGMMPSDDLALRCQSHLKLLKKWRWDGKHYQRTSEAWLRKMDDHRSSILPMFHNAYGVDALRWWVRWRLFFMAVAELFGHNNGQTWWVSHYLFEPKRLR